MADTGWVEAQLGQTVDRDGKNLWAYPTYAENDDADWAQCNVGKKTYSDWERLTDYYNGGSGFDIPTGATIDGIELKIIRYAQQKNFMEDSSLRLRITSGQVGEDKASAVTWDDVEETVYYGGSTDNWGRTWSISELESSDFGVDLSAYNAANAQRAAYIDVIQVKIYYTEAAAGNIDTLLGISWSNVDAFMGIEDTNIDEIMGIDSGE